MVNPPDAGVHPTVRGGEPKQLNAMTAVPLVQLLDRGMAARRHA
jgi:hypothetical protein